MQHEHNTLGRRKHVEHHEQRRPDRLCKERLLLRVELVFDAHDLVRKLVACEVFTPEASRSQLIQADSRQDRSEPSAEILHRASIGTTEPQPCLLDGIVRVGVRAKHAEGKRLQPGPAGLEPLRQRVGFDRRHIFSSPSVKGVTNETDQV